MARNLGDFHDKILARAFSGANLTNLCLNCKDEIDIARFGTLWIEMDKEMHSVQHLAKICNMTKAQHRKIIENFRQYIR